MNELQKRVLVGFWAVFTAYQVGRLVFEPQVSRIVPGLEVMTACLMLWVLSRLKTAT